MNESPLFRYSILSLMFFHHLEHDHVNKTHFIALMSLDLESDLTEAEPVVVLLALFLLESKDQLSDLCRPGLCDQGLHLTDF